MIAPAASPPLPVSEISSNSSLKVRRQPQAPVGQTMRDVIPSANVRPASSPYIHMAVICGSDWRLPCNSTTTTNNS